MRFRFLSLNPEAARTLALPGKSAGTGALALGAAMCLQSVLAGPLHAAPTVGGDDGGPKVRILQPAYQDVLKGKAKILIGIQVGQFNPEFIEMLVDDREVLKPTKLGAAASSQFDWDTSQFSDGPHKLTVRITDTQGFRGWAEVYVFLNNKKVKDYTPPSLEWMNVKQGQTLSGLAQIQLQAMDNFGVKWIIVSVNPESDASRKPPLRSWLLNRPPYRVNFDTRTVPDGIYAMNARAWDPSEQEGVAPQLYFGISNDPISFTRYQERLDLLAAEANGKLSQPKQIKNLGSTPSGIDTLPPARVGSGETQETPESVQTPPRRVEDPSAGNSHGVFSNQSGTRKGALTPGAGATASGAGGNRNLVLSAPTGVTREVPKSVVKAPATPRSVARNMEKATAPAALSNSGSRPSTAVAASRPNPKLVPKSGPSMVATVPAVERAIPETGATLSAPSGVSTGVSGARPATVQKAPTVVAMRPDEPGQTTRTVETRAHADLSPRSSRVELPGATLMAAISREDLPTTFTAPNRLGTPEDESRTILDAAAWSQRRSDDVSVAHGPVRPSRVVDETAGNFAPSAKTAPAGQERSLPKLAANLVEKVVKSGLPVLSPLVKGVEMAAAGRTEQPQAGTEKTMAPVPSAPQLSKPRVATNMAMPQKQPREARAAITVSPLEVSAGKNLPAFHKVERTTNLRAVAARYGIPVEVLATCNNWTPEMKLVAGMKVKFPQELRVSYGGQPVDSDVASMMVGSTSVTAFRFLWEQQGGKLEWDAKKQQVVARNAQHEITLTIGSKTAKIDDKEVMMELAAFLMSGRTMVPVRIFEEGLHAQVEWDPQTGRMYVAMAN